MGRRSLARTIRGRSRPLKAATCGSVRPLLATRLLAAEEAAEPSHTPFYIFAIALVAFALGLSAIGVARHETFPPSRGGETRLVVVCMALVAVTLVTACDRA